MSGLKILILNYEYPPLGGGAGVISCFHAVYLALLGHQVSVVTASENTEFSISHPQNNVRIIKLPAKRKHHFKSGLSEKLSWMFLAEKYCINTDNEKYDICMAHFSIPGGWVAKKLKQKKGTPYVVISHGQDIPWFYPKQMFFYHVLLAPAIKNILLKSERLYVQSEKMYTNATRFLKKSSDKIKIIHNGCDDAFFNISNEKEKTEQTLRLLFVGRLNKQKKPERLIQIAKGLKEKNIEFSLTICGDGALKNKLLKLAHQYNVSNRICFTGWVNKEKIKELYAQHDILVAPSEAEGMSIAILEALFSGLYVITTPVSGNPDIFSKYSLLGTIVMNKAAHFVNAICNYQKEMPNMQDVQSLRQDFIKEFNWKKIVKQYETDLFHAINTK